MPPWLLTGAMYLGIALLVLILGVVWWWVPKWQVNRLRLTIYDPKAYADVEDNFRKTLSQLFGGVAVLLAAVFAYYQFKETLGETEKSRETSQKTSRDLLISQQVSKGFEQLGSDKLVVRLGGIYALEGVLYVSEEYHRPIVEALCAFIRVTSSPPNFRLPVATDITAVVTVLRRRADPSDALDLSFSDLREADLAKLHLANLSGANLSGANFAAAPDFWTAG